MRSHLPLTRLAGKCGDLIGYWSAGLNWNTGVLREKVLDCQSVIA